MDNVLGLITEIASTTQRPIPVGAGMESPLHGKGTETIPVRVTPSRYAVSRSVVQLHPRESVVAFCSLVFLR
jgi:hypothetical protein